MKIKLLAVLSILVLAFAACSRPIPVSQAPSKAAADATLLLAQNLEQKQRWQDSEQTFASALKQYRTFGDLRGEQYALSGLARLAHIAQDDAGFTMYRQQLAELIRLADPEGAHVLLLLDLFVLQDVGDYAGIREKAVDSYDYPLHVRIQVLTHALQAESRLRPEYSGVTFRNLERLSNRYRRGLKKDFSADPGVLASALYAMAYHTYLLRDYKSALKYISEAADFDTRYENFPALGYDLWLKATINEADDRPDQARSDYIRAANIFRHFENTQMLAKTEAALMRLIGD